MLNADTFYQIDYTRLAKQQDDQNLDMALVLRQVPDVSRYGKAILDENGILTGFNEKTADPVPGTINGGIYLMKKSLLEEIPEGKVSLENEMIPKWLSEGKKLGGFVNDGYFIDIGIPEAYFQFQEDVKRELYINYRHTWVRKEKTMVIRGRAPLRVSFGGGGTDVAPFCEQQGGAIIGSTINKYAYCSIVPREDDQIIVHSLDFDMTVNTTQMKIMSMTDA